MRNNYTHTGSEALLVEGGGGDRSRLVRGKHVSRAMRLPIQ